MLRKWFLYYITSREFSTNAAVIEVGNTGKTAVNYAN